jgi:hypothetical protein
MEKIITIRKMNNQPTLFEEPKKVLLEYSQVKLTKKHIVALEKINIRFISDITYPIAFGANGWKGLGMDAVKKLLIIAKGNKKK